ncbi:MAG TPA: hypothetical protein VHW09_17270 [Bryobacteraceae bacterium]|jgi:hypothetical protein|nr:hypothetical protein [Bryobacteraceae bacterium]
MLKPGEGVSKDGQISPCGHSENCQRPSRLEPLAPCRPRTASLIDEKQIGFALDGKSNRCPVSVAEIGQSRVEDGRIWTDIEPRGHAGNPIPYHLRSLWPRQFAPNGRRKNDRFEERGKNVYMPNQD